jgi:endonuclease/exonuclease/phosphatase family metal-dependent hydrolase
MKRVLKIILLIALIPLLYIAGALIYGTITDFKPEEKVSVKQSKVLTNNLLKDSISLYIWNIGYAGLGKESDFFMDGGSTTRMSKAITNKNYEGIKNTIKSWTDADFILLQEVDEDAKRTYGENQFTGINTALGEQFAGTFAYNYKVQYIPVPLLKPYGRVKAGLASYTPYAAKEEVRYQFPGSFSWPKRIFFLDRCMLVQKFPINGKDLVIINTHNSAYDGGVLKPKEMQYLKDFISAEYALGNYVIVGGDWNQCPPGYDCYGEKTAEEVGYEQTSIDADFMPEGWQWGFDSIVTTNRKLDKAYISGETFTTIIDFYLISPNIEVTAVEGQELDFEFSDHQPVKLTVKLKP